MPPSKYDLQYERDLSRRRSSQRMFPQSARVARIPAREPAGEVSPPAPLPAGSPSQEIEKCRT
jgi:hypothetical protein